MNSKKKQECLETGGPDHEPRTQGRVGPRASVCEEQQTDAAPRQILLRNLPSRAVTSQCLAGVASARLRRLQLSD